MFATRIRMRTKLRNYRLMFLPEVLHQQVIVTNKWITDHD
jgi:hypothetical protein